METDHFEQRHLAVLSPLITLDQGLAHVGGQMSQAMGAVSPALCSLGGIIDEGQVVSLLFINSMNFLMITR